MFWSGYPFQDRKKSNCVKEVEKIKQRRNERRAQQMALREQQEQEFDMSQPSWEFEAMIRWTLHWVHFMFTSGVHTCDAIQYSSAR